MFKRSFVKSLIKQCENEIKFVKGLESVLNAERCVVKFEEKEIEEDEPPSEEENEFVKMTYIFEINLIEALSNAIVNGLLGYMIDCNKRTELRLSALVRRLEECKDFLMKEYTDHYGDFPELKRIYNK